MIKCTAYIKRIIRTGDLERLPVTAENGVDALTDLPLINPDIVIVDLLMPEIDGITFVKRARSYAPDLTFIMLSQVASKVYDRRRLFCGH